MHRLKPFSRRSWLAGLLSCASIIGASRRCSFAADIGERTAERLATLKTCDTLTAAFRYFGKQDKPFYQVVLSTEDRTARDAASSFDRWTKLDRPKMHKVLEALADDGFVGAASDYSTKDYRPAQGYSLTLTATKVGGSGEFKALGWAAINGNGHVELYQALGWDLKMIERLERLTAKLDGEAAKDMELLLGRLSGWKRE